MIKNIRDWNGEDWFTLGPGLIAAIVGVVFFIVFLHPPPWLWWETIVAVVMYFVLGAMIFFVVNMIWLGVTGSILWAVNALHYLFTGRYWGD